MLRYIVYLEFNMGLPSPTLLETLMHPTQLKLTRRILGIAAMSLAMLSPALQGQDHGGFSTWRLCRHLGPDAS
jgi:hypothetical protein